MSGTVEVRDGEPWVRVGDGAWRLGARVGRPENGQQVVVGVRPEHLAVEPSGSAPTGDGNGVAASVVAVEWLGHERHLVCDVAGVRLTVRESTELLDPDPGRSVRLMATPDRVQLFDESTGDRLR